MLLFWLPQPRTPACLLPRWQIREKQGKATQTAKPTPSLSPPCPVFLRANYRFNDPLARRLALTAVPASSMLQPSCNHRFSLICKQLTCLREDARQPASLGSPYNVTERRCQGLRGAGASAMSVSKGKVHDTLLWGHSVAWSQLSVGKKSVSERFSVSRQGAGPARLRH